jgi:ferrous iron transport protein B
MGGIILVASILVWALGYFGAKEIVASTIGVLGGLDAITPLAAYAYLLFVLLYFPCIAAVYTILVAWIVSALVYQVGSIF